MAYITKKKVIDGSVKPIGSNLHGTCSTASATAQKDVAMPDFDVLVSGVTIHVSFTYKNTAQNPTLKVGSTSAVAIKCNGYAQGSWEDGSVISFTYDGTNWVQNDVAPTTARQLVDMFYPVGSYYETSNSSFNPNTAWGGTWSLEASGRVHVSAGSGYAIGSTGGAATVLLSDANIGHGHGFTQPTVNGGGGASITGGAHSHSMGNRFSNGKGAETKYMTTTNRTTMTLYTESASHTHSLPAHTHSVSGGKVSDMGGGSSGRTAHNNMPPYIVVNRWHRTA